MGRAEGGGRLNNRPPSSLPQINLCLIFLLVVGRWHFPATDSGARRTLWERFRVRKG